MVLEARPIFPGKRRLYRLSPHSTLLMISSLESLLSRYGQNQTMWMVSHSNQRLFILDMKKCDWAIREVLTNGEVMSSSGAAPILGDNQDSLNTVSYAGRIITVGNFCQFGPMPARVLLGKIVYRGSSQCS